MATEKIDVKAKFGMSPEEVAWEMTKYLCKTEVVQVRDREYWLKLYSECLNAVQNPHQRVKQHR